ncbi:MAG TPA: VCBS repeat-containing protein [Gemmatimonadaceae bacterium]|nr:VCBS repeat-containing protein [Gemmatimonadaceae bacterium]
MKNVLILSLILCAVPLRGTTTAENIAKQFFPAALTIIGGLPVPPSQQQVVFATGALEPGGPTLIVAGYCNSERGSIAVISAAGTPTMLASVMPESLVGRHIAVRLLDLDGDQRLKIVVRVDQYRGLPGTWVYEWSSGELKLLGPTSEETPGNVASELSDATFVDLDGDGVMEVIDHQAGASYDDNGQATVANEYIVGHVGNSTFAPQPVDYFGQFVRTKATPIASDAHFNATNGDHPRDFILVNGTGDPKTRVASATVTLNGSVIVHASDLNEKIERVRLTLPSVATENILSVELHGQPGASVMIVLRPQP